MPWCLIYFLNANFEFFSLFLAISLKDDGGFTNNFFYNGGWSSLEFFEFKSFTSNWAAGIRHTYIEINLYCVDNNNEVCQIRCHEH